MVDMFYGAIKPIFERAEELRKNPTEYEKMLWRYLKAKQLGVRFKRQHPIWIYIADFYSHEIKLVIEVDGSIHNLKEVMEHDVIRQKDIISFGIKVVRFTNKEIRTDIINVIDSLQKIINELRSIQTINEK